MPVNAIPRMSRRRWLWLVVPLLVVLTAAALVLGGALREDTPGPNGADRARRSVTRMPPGELTTAEDYLAWGDSEFERGDLDTALASYSRAIELRPDSAEAYNNRAYLEMTRQDYARALPDLDRALELRPGYVNALMNRGDIYNYYFQVDRARAIEEDDRVLALVPDHTQAHGHKAMAELRIGDMAGFWTDTTSAIRSRWQAEQPVQ